MHSGLAAKKRALDLRGCEAGPDHVGFERAPLIGGPVGGHQ
jgi:hypothetical protein